MKILFSTFEALEAAVAEAVPYAEANNLLLTKGYLQVGSGTTYMQIDHIHHNYLDGGVLVNVVATCIPIHWCGVKQCDGTACSLKYQHSSCTECERRVSWVSPKGKCLVCAGLAIPASGGYDPITEQVTLDLTAAPIHRCYQCAKPTNWLAPDGRCRHCTRMTVADVAGSA